MPSPKQLRGKVAEARATASTEQPENTRGHLAQGMAQHKPGISSTNQRQPDVQEKGIKKEVLSPQLPTPPVRKDSNENTSERFRGMAQAKTRQHTLKSREEFAALSKPEAPPLVLFYGRQTCGRCKLFKHQWQQLQVEEQDVEFAYLDSEDQKKIHLHFGYDGTIALPLLAFFHKGKQIVKAVHAGKMSGVFDPQKMKKVAVDVIAEMMKGISATASKKKEVADKIAEEANGKGKPEEKKPQHSPAGVADKGVKEKEQENDDSERRQEQRAFREMQRAMLDDMLRVYPVDGVKKKDNKEKEKVKEQTKAEKPRALTDDPQECLDAHNKWRALHGVKPLEWDDKCYETAKAWAEHMAQEGKMYHGGHGGMGQNLAMMCGGSPMAITRAVKLWYDEVSSYNFKKPGFGFGTGHFTQVVWRGTTKVGMARVVKGYSTYVCANYSPAGNVMCYFEENVFPAGSGARPSGD